MATVSMASPTPVSKSSKRSSTGFYADPSSPIASTPLKRQRIRASETSDIKVAQPLDVVCPRRLAIDFDDSDSEPEAPPIFSPVLKVDKKLSPKSGDEATVVEEVVEEVEEHAVEHEFNPFYFMKMLPKYDDICEFARPIALPKKEPSAPKICLVLDLDETLVHCSVDDIANPDLKFLIDYNGTEYTVSVKKRPYMTEFLSQVSEWFEVVVFTASQRVYAEKLLNLLDPYQQFIKHRLYRENCLPVEGNFLKDLNVLGRDLSQVVLIDNSPHAFGYQVNNGIPIESWFSDTSDDELLKLLPFLESLMHVDDVRPIVANQFQIQHLIDKAEIDPLLLQDDTIDANHENER
ncbi:nuclear LIM factor interactor-interacting protein hyphal form [Thraustotheca clavata]|uniref:Nuclear LIM factor interactor-interacting protein hyphal form n=1 Tax=Thraustotheca clavata TaxID=74557 RepID=A0A1W0AC67_9STRA|nr:nuclear LIM factor interactor-interacting protein hyphal form [Thraustotheca clavata]